MMPISPMKENILRGLAHYKYLTASHLLKLEVSKSRKKCTDYLRELRKLGFTDRIVHVAVPNKNLRKGVSHRVRHEDLHFLTRKGAMFLDSYTEISLPNIRFPKKQRNTLSNDYLHRVSNVYMHISFDKWVAKNDFENSKFLVYYDNRESRGDKKYFKSETRIDMKDGLHFSPDSILSYSNQEERPFLFCLEIYNGNRTKYVVEQLKKLFWIIENTTRISKKMKVKKTPRILCTCDNEALLENVMDRVKKDDIFWVEHIEQLLFFNLDKQVWDNFSTNWVNIEGEIINLENL